MEVSETTDRGKRDEEHGTAFVMDFYTAGIKNIPKLLSLEWHSLE